MPTISCFKCLVVFLLICCFSCKQNKSAIETDENVYEVTIKLPAGDSEIIDSTGQKYISSIGNIAQLNDISSENLEFFVLATRLNKNKMVRVKPICLMKLKHLNKPLDVVVGIPIDETLKSIDVSHFYDLSSNYYFVKQLIETWYLNRKGIGKMELVSWEDEEFTLSLLKQKLNKIRK